MEDDGYWLESEAGDFEPVDIIEAAQILGDFEGIEGTGCPLLPNSLLEIQAMENMLNTGIGVRIEKM